MANAGASTPALRICSSCQCSIGTDKKIFECSVCRSVLHLKCAPSYYTEMDIDRARRPDAILDYKCNSCIKKKPKPQSPINLDVTLSSSTDEEFSKIVDQNIQFKKEISSLKAQLFEKSNKVSEQDAIIAEFRRISGDRTFDPNMTGISVLTTENPPVDINNKVILAELRSLLKVVLNIEGRVNTIEAGHAILINEQLRPSHDLDINRENGNKAIRSRSLVRKQTNTPNIQKKSFAEILAQAPVSANSIRHIHLNEADGNCDTLLTQIQKDNSLAKEKIIRVQHKGPCDFSVTCLNEEAANNLESALASKYRNGISISTPKQAVPQVKITRLMTDVDHANEIFEQLLEQNAWMSSLKISAERHRRRHKLLKYHNQL